MHVHASFPRKSVLLLLTGLLGPTFSSKFKCFKDTGELQTAAKAYDLDSTEYSNVAKMYGVRAPRIDHVKPA
jgi:hypothetical protein